MKIEIEEVGRKSKKGDLKIYTVKKYEGKRKFIFFSHKEKDEIINDAKKFRSLKSFFSRF